MTALSPRRIVLTLAGPVLALLVAFVVTSLVLLAVGDPVGDVWSSLLSKPLPRQMVNIVNAASVFYLSAIAVAIGFRMNLFNIGVDGQYRVAVFAAAVFAGQAWLPGILNVIVAILIAILCGGLWAGIAAWLKVKRGVSEVISTIMLNAIATGLVSWLLGKVRDTSGSGSNVTNTKEIPDSSKLEGLALVPGAANKVYTLVLLAVLVGFLYWFVLGKTRFGYDLRATGMSETAAVASGVKVPRMVISAMLLSGGVAGLVGMPLLFGQDFSYGTTFQAGLEEQSVALAVLRDVPDAGLADLAGVPVGDVGVAEEDEPRGGLAHPHDDLDQLGLAIALDPGDAEHLAGMDGEGDAVERGATGEPLQGQVRHPEDDAVGDRRLLGAR